MIVYEFVTISTGSSAYYTTFLRKNRLSSVTLPTVNKSVMTPWTVHARTQFAPITGSIERIVIDSDLLRNRLEN